MSLRKEIQVPITPVPKEQHTLEERLRDMDTYRKYLTDNISGFIDFMETFNQCINIMVSNMYLPPTVEFKARIKDCVGAVKTTTRKTLDDIFGFEIITPTETEKEVLMLFVHTIFDDEFCFRAKNHNKSNGYKAHHCVGVLRNEISEDLSDIEQYICNAKVKAIKKKYTTLSKELQAKIPREELYENVDLYPKLKEQILINGHLDQEIHQALKEVLHYIGQEYSNKERKNSVPVTEVQFKTLAVATEAIYGTARHADYKDVDQEETIRKFNNKEFIRLVNFPFKWNRDILDGTMKLQTTDKTLMEMRPFLRMLKAFNDRNNTCAGYDANIVTVFPQLRSYIEKVDGNIDIPENADPNEIWEKIKKLIIPELNSKINIVQKKGEGAR